MHPETIRGGMREILRTNDLVRLSWLQALLSERSIQSVILDSHTSVLEGSVSAIPRRLMVQTDDFSVAMRLLNEYGALDGGKGFRFLMMSAAFSPTMMIGALRLPFVMTGKTEESTTRSPSRP